MPLRQVNSPNGEHQASPQGRMSGRGSETDAMPIKDKRSSTSRLPAAADVLATLATLALVGLAYVFYLATDVKHKLPSDPDMEDDYE
mmetsp:Transcript_5910/g.15726  ORF Transcript_5910/g.15726 Transcript_5910/m.15726 type:complete len:87 (+) Transcript_5910:33-293(+)